MSAYSILILNESGLVSYYRLNEASGTTMTDQTGTNTGTYQGTITYSATGAILSDGDNAITLNGNSANYGLAKSGLIIGNLTNATVEAWVKSSSSSGQAIYCERAASGNDIWKLSFSSSGDPSGSGHIEFTHRDDAGSLTQLNTWTTYNDGNYHHVAITKSGTALTLYVDGSAVRTGTMSGGNTLTNASIESRIGGDKGDSASPLNGSVDDVAVYNVALTAAQISRHSQVGLGKPALLRYKQRPAGLSNPRLPRGIVSCIPGSDRGFTAVNGGTGPLDLVTRKRATLNNNNVYTKVGDVFGNGQAASDTGPNGATDYFWTLNTGYGGNQPFSVALLATVHGWYTGGNAPTGLWGNTHNIGTQTKIKLEADTNLVNLQFLVGSTTLSVSIANVPIEQPCLIVGTSDGSTVRLYVNGQLVASSALTGATGGTYTESAFLHDSNGERSGWADLHGLYIFTRTLTQDEVSAYYRDFWWPFRTRSMAALFPPARRRPGKLAGFGGRLCGIDRKALVG